MTREFDEHNKVMTDTLEFLKDAGQMIPKDALPYIVMDRLLTLAKIYRDELDSRDRTLMPTTQEPKNICKMCGFPIASTEDICGECACEDDCAP